MDEVDEVGSVSSPTVSKATDALECANGQVNITHCPIPYDTIECKICFGVMLTPYNTCNRSHLACEVCVKKMMAIANNPPTDRPRMKCPQCREPTPLTTGSNPLPLVCMAMHTLINSGVVIKCTASKCSTTSTGAQNASEHNKICSLVEVKCPVQGCSMRMSRGDVSKHLNDYAAVHMQKALKYVEKTTNEMIIAKEGLLGMIAEANLASRRLNRSATLVWRTTNPEVEAHGRTLRRVRYRYADHQQLPGSDEEEEEFDEELDEDPQEWSESDDEALSVDHVSEHDESEDLGSHGPHDPLVEDEEVVDEQVSRRTRGAASRVVRRIYSSPYQRRQTAANRGSPQAPGAPRAERVRPRR